MKITARQMAKMIEEKLSNPSWVSKFDRERDALRVEDSETRKGVTVSLPEIISKYQENKQSALEEVVYYIKEALKVMSNDQKLTGKEKQVFPVIRSTSFAIQTNDEIPLIYDEHTAETRVYYALDLGKTYRLIDEQLMEREGWSKTRIKEMALFNVRSLPTSYKKDVVAGNTFYFLNSKDGYDASRILNDSFLKDFKESMIKGEMAVSVPHQDVLIISDIENTSGYDVLQQLTMSFFASGTVPITALSFLYNEDEHLEPIFILAENKQEGKD
ncbi:DUF1444 domain-containing protein [Bacillus carboniphilus]|uniref:DUF1444 domain-containing protein n=1 Tax=Bacillus carboniphilus TaxID=86663 RepID=A0ABY9JXT9_9BACI|nr:DUF1444 domain-containing protein [Bacillus carboniphilus]WLR44211.1 DUF1444 domain-containing protein [Bacillus carboniphilus]